VNIGGIFYYNPDNTDGIPNGSGAPVNPSYNKYTMGPQDPDQEVAMPTILGSGDLKGFEVDRQLGETVGVDVPKTPFKVSGSLEDQVEALTQIVGQLLAVNKVDGRVAPRLTIKTESARAQVEAALRIGLNSGEIDMEDVKKESVGVIKWLAASTGQSEQQVATMLRMTLAAGASALTMVLSGGNFPLGAAVYYGMQGTIPKLTTSSDGGKKELFKGYQAEGQIDGQPMTALDINLPLGLPHDIFGDYRFVVYDRLTGRWMPADEIEPISYWGPENYRYICLDRVTSKIYHADKIRAVRLYV